MCTVTYSCSIITAGAVDICNVADGLGTVATFSPTDGSYSFASKDIVNYPPGTYTMQITGTSGLKQQSFTVDLILINPCATAGLGLSGTVF